MRIKVRYLTPLLAAAGVCASVVLAPVAAAAARHAPTPVRTPRSARPRQHSDRHLTARDEQLVRRLAVVGGGFGFGIGGIGIGW